MSTVYTVSDYIHISDAIDDSGSAAYYQLLFFSALTFHFVLSGLLAYTYYSLSRPQLQFEVLINSARVMMLLLYSVLFFPFFDSFVSIFSCEGGAHYLMRDLQCFSIYHIILIILSSLGLVMFVTINLLIAMLYNETQPV